jgi:hypothetical protein
MRNYQVMGMLDTMGTNRRGETIGRYRKADLPDKSMILGVPQAASGVIRGTGELVQNKVGLQKIR